MKESEKSKKWYEKIAATHTYQQRNNCGSSIEASYLSAFHVAQKI